MILNQLYVMSGRAVRELGPLANSLQPVETISLYSMDYVARFKPGGYRMTCQVSEATQNAL